MTTEARIVKSSAANPDMYRTMIARTSIAMPNPGLATASRRIPAFQASQIATGASRSPCPSSGSVHQSRMSSAIGCANSSAKAMVVSVAGNSCRALAPGSASSEAIAMRAPPSTPASSPAVAAAAWVTAGLSEEGAQHSTNAKFAMRHRGTV